MLNFRQYITEAVAESDLVGVPKTLHDFLFHLSGPSDTTNSHTLKEETELSEVAVFDINRGKDHPDNAAFEKKFPKTTHMIKLGNTLLSPSENLHKKMGEGLRKADDEMSKEDEPTRKAKLKESKKVLESFSKERGYKSAPSLLGENGKTMKSTGEGVHTLGLALAPHTTSGLKKFDVCPRASSDCRKNCLGTEAGGNRQYPDQALGSKVLRTHFLVMHPEHAARILDDEIGKHVKSAKKKGYKPGVRLNVTSDIAWEHHMPKLFDRHKEAQFYDYTKMHNRVGHPDLPKNYHLTLSHTGTGHDESNDQHVVNALEKGHVVASVYQRGKGVPTPTHMEDVKTGKRYPIANGDDDDNTFDRHAVTGRTEGKPGHGVVSGLRLKGVKNEAAGVFANKVDPDGIIRINHPKKV